MVEGRQEEVMTEANVAVVISNELLYEGDKVERKDITYDLPTEIQRNIEIKKRIAKKAIELIDPEDIIFIDSGSTMEFLSREIPENKDLVVVCHAFYVLINTQMKKGCGIIFPGGHFHEDSLVFESDEGVELLKRIRINKAFFAAGGIDSQLGVTCANPFLFNTKRAVINSSYKKILVADSTKFNMVKKVYYADLKEFDAIVTDSNISKKYLDLCKDYSIDVYLA